MKRIENKTKADRVHLVLDNQKKLEKNIENFQKDKRKPLTAFKKSNVLLNKDI